MYKALEYRRQFLLSRAPLPFPSEWKRFQIGPYFLHVHPDLDVQQASDQKKTLVLLGNIYSPDDPESSTADIVKDLFHRAPDIETLVRSLKSCVGRYCMIYREGANSVILNDALGLREIYYCSRENLVLCGSQPNLLAKYAQPAIRPRSDPDFLEYFAARSKNGKWNPVFKWIGDETAYEFIRHLLPNHSWDPETSGVRRYWPNEPIRKLGLDEAVEKACSFLRGSLRALAHRHSIMMAVTAGVDSRTLLAASRGLQDKIYYFVNNLGLGREHPDIAVPAKILAELGVPFHIHDVPRPVDEEFRNIFLSNTFFSSDRILPTIYNVYFKEHSEQVNVLGIGEIGRTRFGKEPKKLDPYRIAYLMKYRGGGYALKQAEKILAELRPVARDSGLNLSTLLYWEHWLGNWGAIGNSESDIAIEEISVFDSHGLYEIFLGVEDKYTNYHNPLIFKEMIRTMWPESAKWPMNPPHGMRAKIAYALKKIGVFSFFKEMKYRWIHSRRRREFY